MKAKKTMIESLKNFACRSLFGADGTDYHRHSVGGFFMDALEAVAGFFIPVAVGCGLVLLIWG